MSVFNIFWCFLCFHTVLSELNILADPCLVTDIECITITTQNFLDNTSGGIPQYDIKPLDPITIPSLDVTPEGVGLTLHFKNIVVNGFKNQKISSFKLNKNLLKQLAFASGFARVNVDPSGTDFSSGIKAYVLCRDYNYLHAKFQLNRFSGWAVKRLEKNTKAVDLKTKIDVVFNSELTIELHKPSKSLSGTIKGEGSAEGRAQYSFSIRTDDKGVEHYEVGPEVNSCEASGDPKFTMSPELVSAVKADADFDGQTENYNAVANKTRQQIICDIVKTVYVTAIHNIRASARTIPKSAYFKDV